MPTYTVEGFQQSELVKLKHTTKSGAVQVLDPSDAIILRWILDFFNTTLMVHKVIDNRVYFWILYETILEELPLLGITDVKAISRRMKKYVDMGILFNHLSKGREVYFHGGKQKNRYGTFTYFSFNPEILSKLLRGGTYKESEYIKKYQSATQDSKVLCKSIQGTSESSAKGLSSPQYGWGLESPTKDHSTNHSTINHDVVLNDLKYVISPDGWIEHTWNKNRYRIDNEPNEEIKLYALKLLGVAGSYEAGLNGGLQ